MGATHRATETVAGELVGRDADPLAGFGTILKGFGVDTDALAALVQGDPDAVTLDDLAVRLDDISADITGIAEGLNAVCDLVNILRTNAGKLAKFGFVMPDPISPVRLPPKDMDA